MNIRYDDSGNITAASVDSFPLTGSNLAQVTDNEDLMLHPGAYTYINGMVASREYLLLTSSEPDVQAGASVPVTVTAYTPSGTVDTSAEFAVTLSSFGTAPVTLTLTNGTASTSYSSSTPAEMLVVASSPNVYSGSLAISFS